MNEAVTWFGKNAKHEPNVHPSASLGSETLIDCQGQVTIGRHVFFGHRVMVLTGLHDYGQFGAPRMNSRSVRPVTIQEGAWIASGAIICPGVTVGRHAVVAAGSVVMRNVPPYTLVGGNPAQRIRKLCKKDAQAEPSLEGI